MNLPDFDANFFQGVIHNGLEEKGDISKVGYIPVTEIDNTKLGKPLMEDFTAAGLNPAILRAVRTVEFNGSLLMSHLGVEQSVSIEGGHEGLLRAIMALELGYVDGKQRPWDARVFIFPVELMVDGEPLEPLGMMDEVGYHVLVKLPQDEHGSAIPIVRMESVCITSMFDGHYATANQRGLGCDCEPQRHAAMDMIYDNLGGGISLLSPLEGRANGTAVHAGQIMMQNQASRNGLALPDTMQSHQLQGVPADSRGKYYFIDAAILKMFPEMRKIILLANNTEKVRSLKAAGIEVKQQPLLAGGEEYYSGLNFTAKQKLGNYGDEVLAGIGGGF